MEDIIKSIKAHLYDRSSSPLFGAFAMSWAVWNYQFILIVLSDEKLMRKFELISAHFMPGQIGSFIFPFNTLDTFFIPAFFCLVYLYGYPKIAEPVYEYSLKQKKKLKEIKQEISDQELLSPEESRAITQQIGSLQYLYDKDTSRLQTQISELKSKIEGLEQENRNLYEKSDSMAGHGSTEAATQGSELNWLMDQLSSDEKNIIEFLKRYAKDRHISFDRIASGLGIYEADLNNMVRKLEALEILQTEIRNNHTFVAIGESYSELGAVS